LAPVISLLKQNKRSVCLISILIILSVVGLVIDNTNGTTNTFSSDSFTQGFQNGCYLGFSEDFVFDEGSHTYQEANSNVSYPGFFFVQQFGQSDVFGFYLDGCNVTVTNYFIGNILEFTTDAAGTVKIYSDGLGAPSGVVNASGPYTASTHILSLTVAAATTVQVIFPLTPGGANPTLPPATTPNQSGTPTPTQKPLGALDFQVNDIILGHVDPNTTVQATITFRYTGSSYTLKSFTLPQPFQTWYIPNSLTKQSVYVLNGTVESSGSAKVFLKIPSDVSGSFSGNYSVTALDSSGGSHVSSALISATTGAEGNGLDFFRNPYILAGLAVVVVACLVCLVVLSPRRR
jgi:hypothetical protein